LKLFGTNGIKILLIATIAIAIIAIAVIYPIFQLKVFMAGELGLIKYEELIENPEHMHGEVDEAEPEVV
jgi:hypothetical protein